MLSFHQSQQARKLISISSSFCANKLRISWMKLYDGNSNTWSCNWWRLLQIMQHFSFLDRHFCGIIAETCISLKKKPGVLDEDFRCLVIGEEKLTKLDWQNNMKSETAEATPQHHRSSCCTQQVSVLVLSQQSMSRPLAVMPCPGVCPQVLVCRWHVPALAHDWCLWFLPGLPPSTYSSACLSLPALLRCDWVALL